jgi:hypothetical protein
MAASTRVRISRQRWRRELRSFRAGHGNPTAWALSKYLSD